MWQKDQVLTLKILLPSGGTVLAVASAAAGYFFGKKQTTKKLTEVFENELDISKNYYEKLYSNRYLVLPNSVEKEDLGDLASKYQDEIEGQGYLPITDEEVVAAEKAEIKKSKMDRNVKQVLTEPEMVPHSRTVRNIFTPQPDDGTDDDDLYADPEWDYEAENHVREINGANVPYVIHRDEFNENPGDYDQTSLTYYEGDSVLVDEKDKPIPDVDPIVGKGNLERFGNGSSDENVVYIRNDRLDLDIEVVRSSGKYSEEVLGIKHSDYAGKMRKHNRDQKHVQPRKFRDDD